MSKGSHNDLTSGFRPLITSFYLCIYLFQIKFSVVSKICLVNNVLTITGEQLENVLIQAVETLSVMNAEKTKTTFAVNAKQMVLSMYTGIDFQGE